MNKQVGEKDGLKEIAGIAAVVYILCELDSALIHIHRASLLYTSHKPAAKF